MSVTAVLSAILTLVAGIGIFLIACQMMSTNLESLSSDKLKALFSKVAGSRMLGVGIGALATAAIQSSGATTVMVIGFVNAGIMSLTQAATIIYGANIGTTITAQIVALGMFGSSALSTTVIFSAFAGVGAFMEAFSKSDMWKRLGGIITGFGMLFVGLSMMSGSMSDFAKIDAVKLFLASIDNRIILVLIGAIFTAIIQSSSVMTSVAIAMVFTGLITLDQGIFLTMGSNIGSCVVAIIAGLTSGVNARRTAMIHLIFNCCGVVFFLLIGWLIELFSGGMSFGNLFDKIFPGAPQTQLAMFHTVFNVLTVILILPLTDYLVSLVEKLVKFKPVEDEDAPHFYFLDENMLKSPPVAVSQVKKEIVNMAAIAMKNFNDSLQMSINQDFRGMDEFNKAEEQLNFLNSSVPDFVIKLGEQSSLSEKDKIFLSTTVRTVSDIERIGDYAENITEYARKLSENQEKFSSKAAMEINKMRGLINELYGLVMKTYSDEDKYSLNIALSIEDDIDELKYSMEANHILRLSKGECTANIGSRYLSLSSDSERVADHLINIGKSILKFESVRDHR